VMEITVQHQRHCHHAIRLALARTITTVPLNAVTGVSHGGLVSSDIVLRCEFRGVAGPSVTGPNSLPCNRLMA
jgi:ABC-type sulfate transport system permease subunit